MIDENIIPETLMQSNELNYKVSTMERKGQLSDLVLRQMHQLSQEPALMKCQLFLYIWMTITVIL